MKQVDVVIGTSYGDEGKGHVTDYLACNVTDPVAVVRFNGGAQAGHTVDTGDRKHIFHHLGSGSLAGAATILSRFFVVNPVLFMEERIQIPEKLNVYVDPQCLVTTPYDVLLNRLRERRRKHGSCGIGFSETISRDEAGFYLRVEDLKDRETIESKLAEISEGYFHPLMRNMDGYRPDLTLEFFMGAEERFITDALNFVKTVTVARDTVAIRWFDHLVFEGAQGLRLDQYSEDFPHVTRSNTGLKNVAVLLEDIDAEVTIYYVSRAYLTRHGEGPLDNEIPNPGIVDTTNVENKYQGPLRFARHDYSRMERDVLKDREYLSEGDIIAVITCCDQYEDTSPWGLYEQFDLFSAHLGTSNLLLSYGPSRADFVWYPKKNF
jgi:adenylosuccinate synthase